MEGPATTEIIPGDEAARERLDRFFEQLDRLTPDELARIGLGSWDTADREDLLRELDEAARRTGRGEMVAEARERARDTVLRRYNEGVLHPTWAGLNWGLSLGRVEDRVGIVQVLSDAAAATVVADVLDAEAFEALSLPAEEIVGMAGGMASEGSLGRALDGPSDPDLERSRSLRTLIAIVAGVMLFVTVAPALAVLSVPGAVLIAALASIVVAGIAVWRARSGGGSP